MAPSLRISVPRFLTAPATSRPLPNTSVSPTPNYPHNSQYHTTYSSTNDDEEHSPEASSLRGTCTTATLNQSTKPSSFPTSDGPASPSMQRGHGIGTIPHYRIATKDDSSPLTRSASRLWKKVPRLGPRTSKDDTSIPTPSTSSFRLRLRPSTSSLRSLYVSSDDSSHGSSPATTASSEKPLPVPPPFSTCAPPIDEYHPDRDPTPLTNVPPPPTPSQPNFKIRRKPVPEYTPGYLPEPPRPVVGADSPSPSAYSSESDSSADDHSTVQIVGPNVFIAYDDDFTTSALAMAFTHVIHLSPAKATGGNTPRTPRSDATCNPETGVHTLYLPIPSPVSHRHIQFASPLEPKIRRKSVPEPMLIAADSDSPVPTLEEPRPSPPAEEEPPSDAVHSLWHEDLVATQEFLAASGRVVSLPELAYFLADGHTPPLGLQLIQINTVLSFLRRHPFASCTRHRVLLITPRGQLALEGLALMACYLALANDCGVRFVLRKFEGSAGTVSKSWRDLLGKEGVVATYLEELLLT
ncbi:hypothetical protein B0H12DRAFT_1141394 [Mycena haematopus]|nr:hypothetical protein B0H12DRAFT_1141394 [Mycena haematopus]